MTRTHPSFLKETQELVRSSRLVEATALIQSRLGGTTGAAPDQTDTPSFDGPTIELSVDRSGPAGARRPSESPVSRARPRFPWANGTAPFPRPTPSTSDMPSGARFLRLEHSGPWGRRAYQLYVPAASSKEPRPLLVMLHGCTQNPEDFAAGTRMNALAEEMGILVAWPEQDRAANASLCWNWFEPDHQARRAGEPAILSGIVEDIARDHAVDRSRVFAAGLSAGGAMAAVLGATYPDLFAAVGVHSGLAHGSAGNVSAALSVMRSGKAAGRAAGVTVPTIVFHGTSDRTVHPRNGAHVAGIGDADTIPANVVTGTAGGRRFTRTVLPAGGDAPAVEHWSVDGLGHAWSGGNPKGSYADAAGPDASREMLRFFLRDPNR